MKVPLETDAAVQENILKVTKVKYQKRNKLIALVTAAVIIVAGVIGGLLYMDRQKDLVKAEIEIADYGTISVTLDKSVAPITVDNFVKLANEGFYDGLTFHRIIAGFMMQGGCPNGNGTGGSEEKIVGEFFYNGYPNDLSHKRGVISMARSNDNNSASSQFFIMHQDYPALDGQYAAFGWVTDGIEIVDAVCESAQPVDGNGTILPEQQPEIVTVRILE
ncbi:MAG: peptidylprolyl isomerase [Oscillospiraceae bacterium]|nr:peptidylprolyl isomerase [Oscillospiraceae bacterium]